MIPRSQERNEQRDAKKLLPERCAWFWNKVSDSQIKRPGDHPRQRRKHGKRPVESLRVTDSAEVENGHENPGGVKRLWQPAGLAGRTTGLLGAGKEIGRGCQ